MWVVYFDGYGTKAQAKTRLADKKWARMRREDWAEILKCGLKQKGFHTKDVRNTYTHHILLFTKLVQFM